MDQKTLTTLVGVYNALRNTHPTQDDIFIISDVLRSLLELLQENQGQPEAPKEGQPS